MISFDKQGKCEARQTLDSLIAQVNSQAFTHIFVFSHGWNNDWDDANCLYSKWILNFIRFHRTRIQGIGTGAQAHPELDFDPDKKARPLFVGIFWPSAAFVLPNENAPGSIGLTPSLVSEERSEVRSLTDDLRDEWDSVKSAFGDAASQQFQQLIHTFEEDGSGMPGLFYSLAQSNSQGSGREPATDANARGLNLSRLLSPLFARRGADSDISAPAPQADLKQAANDVFAVFTKLGQLQPPPGDPGNFSRYVSFFKSLDPRWLIRLATVWQMKDRAGVVGRNGVAKMLQQIVRATGPSNQSIPPRVHLIGHSFGAKVLLSALCAPVAPANSPFPGQVESVLLLQPAISYACFAADVGDGTHRSGGFKIALDRVRQPIFSTFSANDLALRQFYHLAVSRKEDIGEQAAAQQLPPTIFAALGGWGVLDTDNSDNAVKQDFPQKYAPENGVRVLGVNCTPAHPDATGIYGHGDIDKEVTYWLLYNQLLSGARR
jgi:hypothetical protein